MCPKFWSHFGHILVTFWSHFGQIVLTFRQVKRLPKMCPKFWSHFGQPFDMSKCEHYLIKKSPKYHQHFGHILGNLWTHVLPYSVAWNCPVQRQTTASRWHQPDMPCAALCQKIQSLASRGALFYKVITTRCQGQNISKYGSVWPESEEPARHALCCHLLLIGLDSSRVRVWVVPQFKARWGTYRGDAQNISITYRVTHQVS